MKVLCGGHHYYIKGGSDRYMVELTGLLKRYGNIVVPFAVSDPNNIANQYLQYYPDSVNTENPGISDFIRYNYSFSAKRSIEKILRQQDIDVAHLHIYYGQLTTSILRPLIKREIPIVQTLHEYKLTCPVYTHICRDNICEKCRGRNYLNVVKNRCKRDSFFPSLATALEATISTAFGDTKHISHFIAPSEFLKNKMVELGAVEESKITKVPHYIDTDKYRPSDTAGEHVLYFGRLAKVKGLLTLLKSVVGTNVRLVIAGAGPLQAEIEKFITDHDLENVQLVGFKCGKELSDLIDRSICTVLPSEWYDNMPLAVMESMAFGKPVIGARIGGIPELIKDRETGILFDSASVYWLKAAILEFWENPGLAKEMGVAARQSMKNDFNPEDHYAQISRIYSDLVDL